MIVLGIETSCDECAASCVKDGRAIISNVVSSQVELHKKYGGVVPEIAARAHVEAIIPVVDSAITGIKPDAVAVTVGPGLVGSLLVGVSAAKALAWGWGVPLIPVNHIEAHILAPACEGNLPPFPFIALVVSGGHTLLALVRDSDQMEIIGSTCDDALGEAYDKVAKFLGLGYPGGPVIEKVSEEGDANAIPFPRAMMKSPDYNFSFSGLKTAVIRFVEKNGLLGNREAVKDVAASFQMAALEVVVSKTVRAAMEFRLNSVVVGGGVACNRTLRSLLLKDCERAGLRVVFASPMLCTDNAAMVAAAGYMRFLKGYRAGFDLDVYPSLKVGENREREV